MSDFRTRRSALFVPGENRRAIEKAKGLAADVVILDLEDAVAPSSKDVARSNVIDLIRGREAWDAELVVRINGRGTPWHSDDLAALQSCLSLNAIALPKLESAEDVLAIERQLDAVQVDRRVGIWGMLETPLGIQRAYEIATATERLHTLVVGTNDLTNELKASHVPGRQPLLFALSTVVNAARAARRTVLDGVFNDITDSEGFAAECRQGRQFGFDGKTVIHPNQIATANREFSPSDRDVEHAKRIIDAFEHAQAEGKGVIVVDGRLVENLHVEMARRTLANNGRNNSQRSQS